MAGTTAALAETWSVRPVSVASDADFVGSTLPPADVMVQPDGRITIAGALGEAPGVGDARVAEMTPGQMFFEHRPVDLPADRMSTAMDEDGLVQFALRSADAPDNSAFGQDMGEWGGIIAGPMDIDGPPAIGGMTLRLNRQSVPVAGWFSPDSQAYHTTQFDPAQGQWGAVQQIAEAPSAGPGTSPALAFDAAGDRHAGVLTDAPGAPGETVVEWQRKSGDDSSVIYRGAASVVGGVSLATDPEEGGRAALAYVDQEHLVVVEREGASVTQHELPVHAGARLLPRSLSYDAEGRLAVAIGHAGPTQTDTLLARQDGDGQWQTESLPVQALGATVSFDSQNEPYVAAVEAQALSLVSPNIEPLEQGDFSIDPEDPLSPSERVVQAIKNPDAYVEDHPGMDQADLWRIGDLTGDGVVDERDAYAYADAYAQADANAQSASLDLASQAESDPIETRSEAYLTLDLANADSEIGEGDDNFFNTELATGKPYAPGDSRGDLTGPAAGGEADQLIDAYDIDYLFTQIDSDTPDMRADLTDSGIVGQADADVLVEEILGTFYGDINLNGRVGTADLGILLENFGQEGDGIGWATGDLTGNQRVGTADLGILLENFGSEMTVTNTSAHVPEPGTLALLGLGGLLLFAREPHRKGRFAR